MTVNFSLLALDQIMNNAATLAHMSGGQFSVPLVIRMATGGGPAARRPALAQPRGLVRAHPGHQGARAGDASPTPAACCCAGARGPRPGPHLRARDRCTTSRASCDDDAGPVDIERAAVRRAGRRRDADRLRRHRCARRSAAAEQLAARRDRGRGHRPARRCGRSTWPTMLASVAQDPPRRGRRRGLAHRQPRRRDQRADHGAGASTTSTRRSRACAAPRCRCPIAEAPGGGGAAPAPSAIVAAVRRMIGAAGDG